MKTVDKMVPFPKNEKCLILGNIFFYQSIKNHTSIIDDCLLVIIG